MKILDFQVDKKLYKDVIGTVYSLSSQQNEKAGFIKILHDDLSHQDDLKEHFHLCAGKCCSIRNEHYISALSHGQENGLHFVVYEKSSLVPLSQLLGETKILSISDAITFVETLANNLRNAHIDEQVHGHISPLTIFSDINLKQLKIIDFGFDELISLVIAKNKYQELLEALPFYSPEFVVGTKPLGRQADIYSLGVIFYRLLVGDVPWINQGLEEFLQHPHKRSVVPPSLKRLEVPDFLDELILSTLEPVVEDRCPNLSEFLMGIAEVKAEVQTVSTPTTEMLGSALNSGRESEIIDPAHENGTSLETPEARNEIEERSPETDVLAAGETTSVQSAALQPPVDLHESAAPTPGQDDLLNSESEDEDRGQLAPPLAIDSDGESFLEDREPVGETSHPPEDTAVSFQDSEDPPFTIPEFEETATINERPDNASQIDLGDETFAENTVSRGNISEPEPPDEMADLTPLPNSAPLATSVEKTVAEKNSTDTITEKSNPAEQAPPDALSEPTNADSSESLLASPSVVENSENEQRFSSDMSSPPPQTAESEPASLPAFELNVQLGQAASEDPQPDSQGEKDLFAHEEIQHPSELEEGHREKIALSGQAETSSLPLKSDDSQSSPASNGEPNLIEKKKATAGAQDSLPPRNLPQFNTMEKPGVPFTSQDEAQTQFKLNGGRQSLKFYKKQLGGRSFWVVLRGFLIVLIPVLTIYLLIAITFDFKLPERFAGLKKRFFGDKSNASSQTLNQQPSAASGKISPQAGVNTASRNQKDKSASDRTNGPNTSVDSRRTGAMTDRAPQISQLNLQVSVVAGQRAQVADVYLNGRYYGRTNPQGRLLLANLNPNTSYLVKVQKQGFAMWAREVSLKTPGTRRLNVNLTSLPTASAPARASANQKMSTLTVLLSNPQNVSYAFVYINGELWEGGDNIAPAKIQLSPGNYQVEVKRDGYKTDPPFSSLQLANGESRSIYFYLIPN